MTVKVSWNRASVLAMSITLAWVAPHALAQVSANVPTPLRSAVESAVNRSPDVQARWRALLASDQASAAARAGWRPQVDAEMAVGRQWINEPSRSLDNISTRRAEVTLTQLLFDGGVASSAMRNADAQRLQRWAELQESAETVSLEVFSAYVDVLRQRELVSLAVANVMEHKAVVDLLNERVRAAVARGVDLQQATGRLALAEAALVEDAQALHDAETRYLRFVGQNVPGTLPNWPERLTLQGLPASVPALLQAAYAGSPTLRAAAQSVRAAEHLREGREAARIMPVVQARAQVSREHNADGVSGRSEDAVLEVLIRQNLYRGGGDDARLQQADANARQADAIFDNTCRTVRQTVLVAYKDVLTLAQQLQLADQRLLAVDRTRAAFRQQFDIGQRTLLDLLDTQSEFVDAQRQYANLRHDQLIAQGRTLAATGQLTASLGVDAPEWSDVADAWPDNGAPDPVQRCEPAYVEMDSLDRIKASLQFPPRRAASNSFVVLVPNDDGKVGAVVVANASGERVLNQAATRLDLAGAGTAVPVTAADIQRDFGSAIQARPPMPSQFTVFFQSGATQLTPESEQEWLGLVNQLRARSGLDLTVAGHTDTVGSESLNRQLAQRRAEEVVRRLRASGVSFVDVSVVSFGESRPAVATSDNAREVRNRRVEVTAR